MLGLKGSGTGGRGYAGEERRTRQQPEQTAGRQQRWEYTGEEAATVSGDSASETFDCEKGREKTKARGTHRAICSSRMGEGYHEDAGKTEKGAGKCSRDVQGTVVA